MRGRCRIQLREDLGQDACHAEEGQCAREFGVFSGQGRQEPLLGDVFVIGICRILAVHIFFPYELGKTKVGSGQAVQCLAV